MAVACGDRTGPAESDLTPAQARGRELSIQSGCASCHGESWQGGVGPKWVGLAGSDVKLDDGSTVIADTAYLTAAIADPASQRVTGYTIVMPRNSLTPAQVADVVAFIESLGDATP